MLRGHDDYYDTNIIKYVCFLTYCKNSVITWIQIQNERFPTKRSKFIIKNLKTTIVVCTTKKTYTHSKYTDGTDNTVCFFTNGLLNIIVGNTTTLWGDSHVSCSHRIIVQYETYKTYYSTRHELIGRFREKKTKPNTISKTHSSEITI